eukprot:9052294-Lingulodinium_polyedra.AAC.1
MKTPALLGEAASASTSGAGLALELVADDLTHAGEALVGLTCGPCARKGRHRWNARQWLLRGQMAAAREQQR